MFRGDSRLAWCAIALASHAQTPAPAAADHNPDVYFFGPDFYVQEGIPQSVWDKMT